MMHLPDDPGPDHGPLTFRDYSPGVTRVYLGDEHIGDIVRSGSWLGISLIKVAIYLGKPPRHATADTIDQAKTFARQEVAEFFSRTPVKLESQR